MTRNTLLCSLALVASLAACQNVEDAPAGTPIPYDPSFRCDPARDPSESTLRRLTRRQYINTLGSVLGESLDDEERDAELAAVDSLLAALPGDSSAELQRLDTSLSQEHVDAWFEIHWALGERIASSPARRESFLGPCATDSDPSNDQACLAAFVDDFGARVLRRPLRQAERSFYLDEAYGAPSGALDDERLADLIKVMLSAPSMLHHVEDGGSPVEGRDDLIRVSDWELAARLSYHFWQGPPDPELRAAAADGSLSTEEGFAAQVERIFAAPQTSASIDAFFTQWLGLDQLPPLHLNNEDAVYQAFAGASLPSADLRGDMIEEVLDLVRFTTWTAQGTFGDLLTSDRSFAKTPELAAIYGGVPLWTEGEAPPEFVDADRAGLLAHAAFLAGASETTHPILKGHFIRTELLCDSISDPPDNVSSALEDLPEHLGAREQAELLTEGDDNPCYACHRSMNGLGYATENFDSLGRARSEERVFAEDGSVARTAEIRTASEPRVTGSDARRAEDIVDLSAYIAESGKAHACMAEKYFSYAYSRHADRLDDGCALESLRLELAEGGSLRDALRSVALQPEFKLRKRGE